MHITLSEKATHGLDYQGGQILRLMDRHGILTICLQGWWRHGNAALSPDSAFSLVVQEQILLYRRIPIRFRSTARN